MWSAADLAILREFVTTHHPFTLQDWEPLAHRLGRTIQACRLRAQKEGLHGVLARRKGTDKASTSAETSCEGAAVPSQGQANGDLTHVSPLGPSARSEAEMVALFQVDLTRWEVVKLSHNVWEAGQKGPDGEPVVQPLCQTTLTCRRIPGVESLAALTDTLLASLTKAAPPRGPFVIKTTKAQHLLELDPVDLHWGKLGWDAETESANYDISIATRDFKAATDDLLSKTSGFKLAKALLVIGNDLLHTDNLKSETTSGTRVDSDSRYHRSFDAATEAMRWAIERAKQVAPLVEVVVVPGNHDRLGAFTVGRVLEAIYQSDPRVKFDNRPPLRKYVRWGHTLLGFTHGSEEKMADLPLIMAQERPQDWAETVYRGWRIGHFHKRKQTKFTAGDSFQGVEVRVVRSLSGTDAWHYSRGFVKERRGIEAFVHHIEDGEVGAFLSRLPTPNHITRDNARTD